jgi:hypothetical protein
MQYLKSAFDFLLFLLGHTGIYVGGLQQIEARLQQQKDRALFLFFAAIAVQPGSQSILANYRRRRRQRSSKLPYNLALFTGQASQRGGSERASERTRTVRTQELLDANIKKITICATIAQYLCMDVM